MDYQKTFISMISTYLPKDTKLVDFISDIIHVGKEASYRRIRGEVEFSLSEIIIIAKKLNINLNSLIISEGGVRTVFNFRVLPDDVDYVDRYVRRKKSDLYLLEGFGVGTCVMIKTKNTIPEEFTYDLPYITKLNILKIQFVYNSSKAQPLEAIAIPESILLTQTQYIERLSTVDLSYLFDPNLFLPIITDIHFFRKTHLISDEDVKHLKAELLELIDIMYKMTDTGVYKNIPVTVYVSHTSINQSSTFLKAENQIASVIELNHNNSLLSFDANVCKSQESNLNLMKKYTSLITEAGEIDKVSFFKQQKQLIAQL